jgi:hypothetical protein
VQRGPPGRRAVPVGLVGDEEPRGHPVGGRRGPRRRSAASPPPPGGRTGRRRAPHRACPPAGRARVDAARAPTGPAARAWGPAPDTGRHGRDRADRGHREAGLAGPGDRLDDPPAGHRPGRRAPRPATAAGRARPAGPVVLAPPPRGGCGAPGRRRSEERRRRPAALPVGEPPTVPPRIVVGDEPGIPLEGALDERPGDAGVRPLPQRLREAGTDASPRSVEEVGDGGGEVHLSREGQLAVDVLGQPVPHEPVGDPAGPLGVVVPPDDVLEAVDVDRSGPQRLDEPAPPLTVGSLEGRLPARGPRAAVGGVRVGLPAVQPTRRRGSGTPRTAVPA